MNITTSNVNFAGKREVLYGLKMTAKEAHNAEFFRGVSLRPRTINKMTECWQAEALADAYASMTVYDDEFYSTIKDIKDEEVEELKLDLRSEKWDFIQINPLAIFKKSISKSLKKHNKSIDTEALLSFYEKISDKTIYRV